MARIMIVGLGTIGQVHAQVLETFPGAEVVAAVDTAAGPPMSFRGTGRPVYRILAEAAARHQPDVVIIATPTATHQEVWAEAAACLPYARILVEKPAADTLPGAELVLGGDRPADVAYHMMVAPEVTWGLQSVRDHASLLGPLDRVTQLFTDPYQGLDRALRTFTSAWTDSGINALSVLAQFATVTERRSLLHRGPLTEARLACQRAGHEADVVLVTSWLAADPAKTTRLTFASGTELILDHTAITGYLIAGGALIDSFGCDASIPRRIRHYTALHRHWLSEGKALMPAPESLYLHQLLLTPDDGLPWPGRPRST
jgi:hypothetical protein